MGIAKVTRNYQVTIPKDIRLSQDIEIGDSVVFSVEGDRIDIVKLQEDTLEKAFGCWKDKKESSVSYQKRLRKEWEKREKRESK